MAFSIDKLGKPELKLAGFQLWVHNRQFPEHEDYWDGNWLNVTAYCGAQGASVTVTGSIVHLSDIACLLKGAESMYAELKGQASLPCIEPELYVELKAKGHGHIDVEVSITPDNLTQSHHFRFEIDQSYLPGLTADCQKILAKFPIKGKS